MFRRAALVLTILLAAASGYCQTPMALGTVSTRAHVGAADDQLISGWILRDAGTANVLIRALGPSLSNVSGRLANPALTLVDMNGEVINSNDNWKDSPQRAAIEATGRQPTHDLESAILAPLPAGEFTSIVYGANNTTGIAKVEMIDLEPSSAPAIVNITTRARAGAGNAAPLSEFVVTGSVPRKVMIRGIGPSLAADGFADPLRDPTLTLRDSAGQQLVFNNNWRDTQQAEVEGTNLAPTNNAESAIVATLAPGTYTAELQGLCGATGVALIEVFYLGSAPTPSIPASSPVLSCGPAAPSVVVTNTNDGGAGSLRAAIAAAPPGGTIGFSKSTAGGAVNFYDGAAHTITLTSGVLPIDKSVAIFAPNPNLLTVSGNQGSRVFVVNTGVTATIDNLKVANGVVAFGPLNGGGGIYNSGNLTVSNCIVSNNSVTASAFAERFGGGIYSNGTLNVVGTVISNNVASGGLLQKGGGIANENGLLTITNSTIANNAASGGTDSTGVGGGIYTGGGTATINGSIMSANSASGGLGGQGVSGGTGGAVYNDGSILKITDSTLSANIASGVSYVFGGAITTSNGGPVTISRTTLDGNSVSSGRFGEGGAIYALSPVTVVDSTISNNTAKRGGGVAVGDADSAMVTLTNSTVSGNSATGSGFADQGGGIYNAGFVNLYGVTVSANSSASPGGGGGVRNEADPNRPSVLNMKNTILSGNTASTQPDASGTIRSRGHNLLGNASGVMVTGITTGNIINQNANLGPLADHRGPTKTMRVLPASPAIDGGADVAKLVSTIDPSTTSITITHFQAEDEVTAFPAGVGFVLRIDAEQMIVVGRNGNTLTVTRGVNGTSPAQHSAGTGVNPAFDQGGQPRKAGSAIDIGAFETNYTLSITSGASQSTIAGSPFGSAFQLQLLENGQPLAGISVTFKASMGEASGAFAGGSLIATVVTDANGFATAPAFVANGRTGTFTVTVTIGSSLSTLSYNLTNLPRTQLLNLATRMKVLADDNILIAGFIVTGSDVKQVIVRAIGPSLVVGGALPDPVLEVYNGDGTVIGRNDDWKTATDGSDQQEAIERTGVAPTDDRESALIISVHRGTPYTAAVSGKEGSTGIGLVELYDLSTVADSQLANISTRGFVDTGDDVMIGGFILGPGTPSSSVLVRGMGPSLRDSGVANALADPRLDLFNANGDFVAANDNWKTNEATGESQQSAVEATTIPPTNDLEAAILITLQPGAYTAVLAGKDGTTGVGLVELYNLR